MDSSRDNCKKIFDSIYSDIHINFKISTTFLSKLEIRFKN